MKIRSFMHISIFLYAFLMPQTVFLLFSLFLQDSNDKSRFLLHIETEQERSYFQSLSESMEITGLGTQTLQIMFNNIVIGIIIWSAVGIIYLLMFEKNPIKTPQLKGKTFKLAYAICLIFFLKEGFRIGFTILDLYHAVNLPYFVTLTTLVMPHAIFEFMGFIMVALFSLFWLKDQLNRKEGGLTPPKALAVILPILLISVSAVLETAVTPVIFSHYIASVL